VEAFRIVQARVAATVTAEQADAARKVMAAARAHVRTLVPPGTVMALPTAPCIAPPLDLPDAAQDDFRTRVMRLTCIAGLSGLPQMSIPVGTAGADKRIVLQLDNAGWHGPENLAVPDGIRLVFQPAHSPELLPAEHLWRFVDEPLANRCFATIESLDHAVGQRCLALTHQCDTIRDSTSSTGGRASHQGRNQPESV
jgi:DDE superfamily endonuclease